MKSKFIYKIILTFCLLLSSSLVSAQSSGDRLYNQGLELQKKQTVSSQRAAINKFTSAKKLYDSSAKKKQCDNAIQVSRNIIKSLSSRPTHNTSSEQVPSNSHEIHRVSLELSNDYLKLDHERKTVTVSVMTNAEDWSVLPISNEDGSSFITARKESGSDAILITCSANTSTIMRTQKVMVKAHDEQATISIVQDGRPIILTAEKTLLEFSRKGGNKTLDVYCNSDATIEGSNNQNWEVISIPSWVDIVPVPKKSKSFFSKVVSSATDLVKSNVSVADDPTVKTSTIKVIVNSIPKNSREYSTGRKGEIILGSGDQRVTIVVVQD